MERANSNEMTIELNDSDLDTSTGGKGGVTYYEMGGNWYIVGHDKHGHATGAVQVTGL
jgi:hypothetical protein